MTETKPMTLMRKLARARVMLQKRNLKKSGQNKFAGFRYFELADFLPSVNEIFDELGLYAEFYIEPEDKRIDQETGEITIYSERAHLDIYNADNPSVQPRQFVSAVADAGTKGASPIQQLGSVHTYMRRYLYMEALEIVESDALDAVVGSEKVVPAESSGKPKTPRKQPEKAPEKEPEKAPQPQIQKASPIQVKKLTELLSGERLQNMLKVYKISKPEELTATQAMVIIEKLEKEKKTK